MPPKTIQLSKSGKALVKRAGAPGASDRSPRLHLPWTLGALSLGRNKAPTHVNLFWDCCLLWKLRMPVRARGGLRYGRPGLDRRSLCEMSTDHLFSSLTCREIALAARAGYFAGQLGRDLAGISFRGRVVVPGAGEMYDAPDGGQIGNPGFEVIYGPAIMPRIISGACFSLRADSNRFSRYSRWPYAQGFSGRV